MTTTNHSKIPKKITIVDLQKRKLTQQKLTMLTAYDATFSRIFDAAAIDILLVGDSLGMVIKGAPNTLEVKLTEIIYHTRAVSQQVHRAHVVSDLPFMTYQISEKQALQNAAKVIQLGGAEAVKLEGGRALKNTIRKLTRAGIPVMGHLGLTPQYIHQLSGFKVQGKTARVKTELQEDAQILEDAGCYALVLEGMPSALAQEITKSLTIPTIGIGAGPHCDGQVLVCYDLLGLHTAFKPKFVKHYLTLDKVIQQALQQFKDEVTKGLFPSAEHCYE